MSPTRTFLRETCTPLADIRLLRSDRGDSIVRRNCPDGQFWLVSRGSWHFKDEGPSRTIGALDIAYSAPQEPCVRTAEDQIVAFGVQVRHRALSAWPEGRAWLQPVTSVSWEMKRAFFGLMANFVSGGVGADDLEDQIVGLLTKSRIDKPECGPRWLDTARAMLHEEQSENQTLFAIAAAVGVTPSHLSVSYRAQFGVPMAVYRRRVRLERAFTLASQSGVTLNIAAIEAGFYDASHFHRACTAEFGLTPSGVQLVLKAGQIESLYKTAS